MARPLGVGQKSLIGRGTPLGKKERRKKKKGVALGKGLKRIDVDDTEVYLGNIKVEVE